RDSRKKKSGTANLSVEKKIRERRKSKRSLKNFPRAKGVRRPRIAMLLKKMCDPALPASSPAIAQLEVIVNIRPTQRTASFKSLIETTKAPPLPGRLPPLRVI
ncbi:MAG: hypothetical protein ABIQ57_11300, partial [Candidatus Kapaibacterium sp.]